MRIMSGDEFGLTDRELQIVKLLATGMTAKEVAVELDIAPKTVEHYIEQARLKTRTRNRVHLISHVLQKSLSDKNGA